MLTFTQDDVTKLHEFGKFLITKAVFNGVSIQDAIALNKFLQHYNVVVKKMEDSIMEVVKVSEPEETTKKKK